MALLKPRGRKLIGAFLIVVLIAVYALVTVTIASVGLGNAQWYIHMIFFATTGILWIVPAMIIVKWMAAK